MTFTAGAGNGVSAVDAGVIGFQAIWRREGAAGAVGVDADLGLVRDAVKIVEVDLTRAGVTAGAISLVAEGASVVVALDTVFATEAVGVVEADAIFTAVEDAGVVVAVDAITAGDDVVDADAGVDSARSAATVDRSVPQLSMW